MVATNNCCVIRARAEWSRERMTGRSETQGESDVETPPRFRVKRYGHRARSPQSRIAEPFGVDSYPTKIISRSSLTVSRGFCLRFSRTTTTATTTTRMIRTAPGEAHPSPRWYGNHSVSASPPGNLHPEADHAQRPPLPPR